MDIQVLNEKMKLKQFPLSSKYDIGWLAENEMGPCSTWLVEYLFETMEIRKGMRILDLGCGKAMSSIFIAKEYGAHVWATDLWINATENLSRIKEINIDDLVFPINAEAHSLPYAEGYFDAIISVDAYHYFGTDEMYLPYIVKFLKPNGKIGIVVPGVNHEWTKLDIDRIGGLWEPYNYTHHTPDWWRELWNRSECVNVDVAENMPDGYKIWLHWDKTLKEAGVIRRGGDVEMLERDGGNFTWTKLVATKK
jgi:cyclopropane fatty-acyl-phospholipid synthase-like methyltransferase